MKKAIFFIILFTAVILSFNSCAEPKVEQETMQESVPVESIKSLSILQDETLGETTEVQYKKQSEIITWLVFSTDDKSCERELVLANFQGNMISSKDGEIGIAIADINNDGLNDIVSLTRFYFSVENVVDINKPFFSAGLDVYINNGEGFDRSDKGAYRTVLISDIGNAQQQIGLIQHNDKQKFDDFVVNNVVYSHNRDSDLYEQEVELQLETPFLCPKFIRETENKKVGDLIYNQYLKGEDTEDLEAVVLSYELDLNGDEQLDLFVLYYDRLMTGSAGNASLDIYVAVNGKYNLVNCYILFFPFDDFQKEVSVYGEQDSWKNILINGALQVYSSSEGKYVNSYLLSSRTENKNNR